MLIGSLDKEWSKWKPLSQCDLRPTESAQRLECRVLLNGQLVNQALWVDSGKNGGRGGGGDARAGRRRRGCGNNKVGRPATLQNVFLLTQSCLHDAGVCGTYPGSTKYLSSSGRVILLGYF